MWLTGLVAPQHVGSSQTRARTRVPCIGRRILNHCATREAPNSHFYADTIYCSVLWAPNLYIQMVNFECPQPYLKGKHANAVVWSETKLILVSPFPPPPRLDSPPGQPGSGDDPAVQLVLQTKGLGVVPNTPLSPGSYHSVHYSACIFSNLLISFQLLCCLLSSSCHHFSPNWPPNTSSCHSPLLIKSNYF